MRQARSVELVAQRRRMELFMRSQVRLQFAACNSFAVQGAVPRHKHVLHTRLR